jgi:hypothetical protein
MRDIFDLHFYLGDLKLITNTDKTIKMDMLYPALSYY